MPEYIVPTSAPVDPNFSPETFQEWMEEIAAHLRIPFPTGYTQMVISTGTPDPSDNSKTWLKVDGSSFPKGLFRYAGGGWVPVAPSNVYFATDTGTANAIAIAVADYPYPTLQPGLFLVKMNATNTGAATLTVNAFAAKPVKFIGADPYAGALVNDGYFFFYYDGTNFEIVHPAQKSIPTILKQTSTPQSLPAQGANLPWSHTLGARPTTWSVTFICTVANNGYDIGDPLPYDAVSFGGANNEQNAFSVSPGASALVLVNESGGFSIRTFLHKTTGVVNNFVASEWNVVFEATLLTPAA